MIKIDQYSIDFFTSTSSSYANYVRTPTEPNTCISNHNPLLLCFGWSTVTIVTNLKQHFCVTLWRSTVSGLVSQSSFRFIFSAGWNFFQQRTEDSQAGAVTRNSIRCFTTMRYVLLTYLQHVYAKLVHAVCSATPTDGIRYDTIRYDWLY